MSWNEFRSAMKGRGYTTKELSALYAKRQTSSTQNKRKPPARPRRIEEKVVMVPKVLTKEYINQCRADLYRYNENKEEKFRKANRRIRFADDDKVCGETKPKCIGLYCDRKKKKWKCS